MCTPTHALLLSHIDTARHPLLPAGSLHRINQEEREGRVCDEEEEERDEKENESKARCCFVEDDGACCLRLDLALFVCLFVYLCVFYFVLFCLLLRRRSI